MTLKKSKISFILSLVGFTEIFILILSISFFKEFILTNFFSWFVFLNPVFFYSAWLFDVAGIVYGIMVLKLEEKKKKLAIAGITLSVLGLFEYFLLFYVLAKMFGMLP